MPGHFRHDCSGIRHGLRQNAPESGKRNRNPTTSDSIGTLRTQSQFDPVHAGEDVGKVFPGEVRAILDRLVRLEKCMREPKVIVRYLGFQTMLDGSRRLDFSFSAADATQHVISVEASHDLFAGPDHMSIQECPGICYETLKCHIAGCSATVPASISLTSADVAQHRRSGRTVGRRPNP